MRKVVLLMGMGLNGVGAEGWIPWLESWAEAEELFDDMWLKLDSADTFLLGRKCFQLWKKVWPPLADDKASTDFEKKFSRFTNDIQKVVFSKTLKRAGWRNARLVAMNLKEEINRMKRQGGKNMIIVGGPGIARSFTKLDLIDEYQIYIHPTIYPQGGSLLDTLKKERQLKLMETKVFKSGVVRLGLEPINQKKYQD